MTREQIRVDIPDEWLENMKHGRCWCGKDHTEFDKGQKFYCSEKHATEYSKRITYWSVFKDKILAEHGEKCSICNMTDEKFKKKQEQLEKKTYLEEAKKYPDAIKQGRAIMLAELQEKFELIMDDAYVFDNMIWQIKEEHGISRGYDIFRKEYFTVEVDHIIAVALGGDMWDEKNCRVLCNKCHKKKTKEDMKKLKIKKQQEKNEVLIK